MFFDSQYFRIASALLVALILATPCIAQDAATLMQRAQRYLIVDQYDSALLVLDSAINLDTTSALPWRLRYEAHIRGDDTSAAQFDLERALKLQPANQGVRFSLLELLLEADQAESALAHVHQTPPRNRPMSPAAWLLWGRVFEANGYPDTAISYYKRAHDDLTRRDLPLTPLPVGSKLSTLELTAPNGERETMFFRSSMIIVFWATWSEASEIALRDIAAQARKAAMTWKLIPVNVDTSVWQAEAAAAVVNRAVTLGCKDTVRFDPGWSLVRAWAIDHLPCIVTVEHGGTVTDVVHGWDSLAQERILRGTLGSLSDSVVTAAVPRDTVRGRAVLLRAMARREWRGGRRRDAMKHIAFSVRADPTSVLSQADLIAYRWLRGDTAGARIVSDSLLAHAGSNNWARLLAAHIKAGQGRLIEAVDLLSRSGPNAELGIGQYNAALALLAARAGRFDLASAAYQACQKLNRFNILLPEFRALRAEHGGTGEAARLWRTVVTERLPAP